MEAALKSCLEGIRQDMRREMAQVLQRAADSCASVCMRHMQEFRTQLLCELEAADPCTPRTSAVQEVKRRTSFYDLFSKDELPLEESVVSTANELAELYEHFDDEFGARPRKRSSLESLTREVEHLQTRCADQEPTMMAESKITRHGLSKSSSSRTGVTDRGSELEKSADGLPKSSSSRTGVAGRGRVLKKSASMPLSGLTQLEDFLGDGDSIETKVQWLEICLHPRTALADVQAGELQDRVHAIEVHVWGTIAAVFQTLELQQRVELIERVVAGCKEHEHSIPHAIGKRQFT
eukprot:TRINITY_DN9263_c0_g1_i1.p1 TRINITY_DN9263_c0_g1~~TRINITY_DN9263_c0_g1_i1.p1  ORF type:complete len:321 (+),score=68.35 TRINITY_DN9263_c0_g1_i1:87-965(+)